MRAQMKADENRIYLRMRHRLEVQMGQTVRLKDCCQLIVEPALEQKLSELPIHLITPEDEHIVIIDIMRVIKILKGAYPELEVESFGAAQTIVEIILPKKKPQLLLVLFVCLLLFIGSGLAIMYFHEDVSMLGVHQKIYRMITGKEKQFPLLLQIPYSFGIGLGMILFFNHLFKKRLNEEPSPLEVEMFLYQQNLDQYVVMNENKEVHRKMK